MANTYTLIASSTVGSGGSSTIDFTSIPATYTDLLVKLSIRGAYSGINQSYNISFNGTSITGMTSRRLYGDGASAASDTSLNLEGDGNTATASTFSNDEVYIPNYAGSTNKSFSIDNVVENNATTAYPILSAGLWSNAAAINRIVFTAIGTGGNFSQYSTAYLYGIKNS